MSWTVFIYHRSKLPNSLIPIHCNLFSIPYLLPHSLLFPLIFNFYLASDLHLYLQPQSSNPITKKSLRFNCLSSCLSHYSPTLGIPKYAALQQLLHPSTCSHPSISANTTSTPHLPSSLLWQASIIAGSMQSGWVDYSGSETRLDHWAQNTVVTVLKPRWQLVSSGIAQWSDTIYHLHLERKTNNTLFFLLSTARLEIQSQCILYVLKKKYIYTFSLWRVE